MESLATDWHEYLFLEHRR